MKNSLKTLVVPGLICLLLVSLAPIAWGQPGLPMTVNQALKQAGIPLSSVAVMVQDVGARRPLLAINGDVAMNPASTMKLVTTFAALDLLGPTYNWKTEVFAAGGMQGDTLDGDLVLKGYGDPKLTLENFWLMLRALRARGLREIRGDLLLDRSWFEAGDYDPARFDNDPLRPYNVAPDALLVNFKAVSFQFVPDAESKTVRVITEPRLSQLETVSTLRLSDAPCGDWRASLKADFQSDGSGMRAVFAGLYPVRCGEQTWNVSLFSHPNYVYGMFRRLWEEMGGTLRGGMKEGDVPPEARLLYTNVSPSLAEVVRDINKFSNNVMARQLFLTLSAELLKQPGRSDRSFQVVQSWLEQRGLAAPELVMENGSGLSRNERISAATMTRLLAAAYRSAVMPEFIASLPLVAYDGTMRQRLKYESVAGQAHIKTGSLHDARTLAGYLLDKTGRQYVVVFFINHANAAQGQAAQDALLKWLYEGAVPQTTNGAE